MAGFFSRLFARLFGKKQKIEGAPEAEVQAGTDVPAPGMNIPAPGMNIPAPHTLVARVGSVAISDERGMIKLAEESVKRGFPEQAAIAYRKAAARFKDEGKHLKRIAVLNQLARVSPNDPRPYLELVEANEVMDRKRDADLARMAAAEIMRRIGRAEDAVQLERQIAKAAPPMSVHRQVEYAGTADDDLDSVAEMPGDAVPFVDEPGFSDDSLDPVMPVDFDDEPKDPDLLTMSKIDCADPLDLSLDSEDQLDALDAEAAFDSVPSAPQLDPKFLDPATTGARPLQIDSTQTASGEAHSALSAPLGIDSTLTASNEHGALSIDETVPTGEPDTAKHEFDELPLIQSVKTASDEHPQLHPDGISIDDPTDNDGFAVQTIAADSFDDVTADANDMTMSYSQMDVARAAPDPAEDVGAQTIAMSAVDSSMQDVGAQTIAMSSIDTEDHADVGAQTIALGSMDSATMLGALDGVDDGVPESEDVGAQTIAIPAIPAPAHTRELPKNVRFNIGDAATQMDPRGLPEAVVGTEHEVRAREESRIRAKTDDDLAKALRSKIGS